MGNPFHAPHKLGKTQRMTPEGFLLIEGVRVGRTGEQLYGPAELTTGDGRLLVQPGADGVCRITRDASEVFSPVSIASLNGSTLTIKHPAGNTVTPETYRTVSVGDVLNGRQGDGEDDGFLLADFLVKDAAAIHGVRTKTLKEVSAGYEAVYLDIGDGRGTQHNIRHNHVALLDGPARCGPECAIGDKMTDATDKPNFAETLLARLLGSAAPAAVVAPAVSTGDAAIADLKAQMAEMAKGIAALTKKMTGDAKDEWGEDPDDKSEACEARRAKMKADKKDGEAKTGDAATLGARAAMVRSRAEILAPGASLPAIVLTGDAKATVDAICACERSAIKAALASKETADAVKMFLGDADPDTLSAGAIEMAFVAAAEIVRARNNAKTGANGAGATVTGDAKPMVMSDQLEAFNKAARDGWAKIGQALAN